MIEKFIHILPLVIIIESFLAVIPLVITKKFGSALYWFSCGLINLSVVMLIKRFG